MMLCHNFYMEKILALYGSIFLSIFPGRMNNPVRRRAELEAFVLEFFEWVGRAERQCSCARFSGEVCTLTVSRARNCAAFQATGSRARTAKKSLAGMSWQRCLSACHLNLSMAANMRRMNKFAAFHLCHSLALSFRRNDGPAAGPAAQLHRQPRVGLRSSWRGCRRLLDAHLADRCSSCVFSILSSRNASNARAAFATLILRFFVSQHRTHSLL